MDEQTKHDDKLLYGMDLDAVDRFVISSLSDFYHTYKDTSNLIYEETHKPVQESDLHQRFKSSEANLYDLSRKYEDNPPGAYDKPVLLSKNIFEVGHFGFVFICISRSIVSGCIGLFAACRKHYGHH